MIEDAFAIGAYSSYIVSSLAALAGFLGGWFIQIQRTNEDARTAHFNELKKYVVEPIVYLLENASYSLPSIQETRRNAITSDMPPEPGTAKLMPIPENQQPYRKIDSLLLDDFLTNHFDGVELLWNELYEINTITLRMQNEIIDLIHDTTQRRILHYNLNSVLTNNTKYYKLDFREFENVLKSSLLAGKNDCSKIDTGTTDKDAVYFNDRQIYRFNTDDDREEIKSSLRNLCHSIMFDEHMNDSINGSEGILKLLDNRNRVFRELYRRMKIIDRQTKLRSSCEFV